MVKVKIRRLGKWYRTLYHEISDELNQWASKHNLHPRVDELDLDSFANMGWVSKTPLSSGNVLDLFWCVIGSILGVRIQVYGDEWADSAIEFAHTLELRIPPMLPKGFKMREIELEVKPPRPKSIRATPLGVLKIAVHIPNCTLLQQVFGPRMKFSPNQGYFETLGATFAVQDIIVEDVELKFLFWLINPEQSFSGIRRGSYSGSDAGIFLYELTNKTSFLKALELMDEFDRFAGKNTYRVLLGYAHGSKSEWYPPRESLDLLLQKGWFSHFELDLNMEERKHEQVFNEIYRAIAMEIMKQLEEERK